MEKILLGVFTENMWVGKGQKSSLKASLRVFQTLLVLAVYVAEIDDPHIRAD